MKPVSVDSFTGPYQFLSNFFIEPDGSFVEYEYQRAKCSEWHDRNRFDEAMEKRILTPAKAKQWGRRVKIREDWEDVRVSIMLFYVTKKYTDHEDLRILLRLTDDMQLIEGNTWGDTFWGKCGGKGLNILGDIHMQIRSQLPELFPDV